MQKSGYVLLIKILWLLSCSSITMANNAQPVTKYHLMTARDIKAQSFSNITIQNKTGGATTVYGLYINTFADNTPLPHDCTAPNVLYSPNAVFPNTYAAGAFVAPIALRTNQKIPIGKNYLYNMIYTAIYYGNQAGAPISNPPMPCALPGCSWDVTTPSTAPDVAGDEWCIYLGVLAPTAGNSTTSNVPPMANLVNDAGAGYNYNAVVQYGYIGPIICNDNTLTCAVNTAQNVAFPQ